MTELYCCGEDSHGWYIAEFGSHEKPGHCFSEAFAKRVTAALNISGSASTEYLEGFAKSGISMDEALSITRESLTRCRSDLRAALNQISELISQFRFAPNGVSQIKSLEVARNFMTGALAREAQWPKDESVIADDKRDAERYRKLCASLQEAYDGTVFETNFLTVYCHMQSGYRDRRNNRAEIFWTDVRDEPLDLGSAIDAIPTATKTSELKGDAE